MITKIDIKEITTCLNARQKYENKYIGMVVTDQKLQDPDNTKGYVIYLMDSYDETFKIPRRLEDGSFISSMPGMAVGGTEIGGVFFDD